MSRLLGIPVAEIRRYMHDDLVQAQCDADGEERLSFQDLVLLRTAKGLREARVPASRVREVLEKLRGQLPTGQPVSAAKVTARDGRVVVQEGGLSWQPESGQGLLDFAAGEPAPDRAPLTSRWSEGPGLRGRHDWYELGCELESSDRQEAVDAYRRALAEDPDHLDAHLNLGRCLHEAGEVEAAEEHYRRALEISPEDATASFNLGVALEDLGREDAALDAYERAIELDAECPDAFYNAAHLYEKRGETAPALRCLKSYRRLTKPSSL